MSKLHSGAIAAAMALAFSTAALAAQGMSRDDYRAGKDKIAAEFKSARTACNAQTANAKDVCMAEATGKQKVARAELEASNKPGAKTRNAVSVAKAEADYAVGKEECDAKVDNERKACMQAAKAAQTRAKADAKASMRAAGVYRPVEKKSAASTSKSETAGVRVDDDTITDRVKEAVERDPSLKSADINVETSKGRVQLSGFVNSRDDINRAVKVAKGVKGVKVVMNDMILKGAQ
jgi:osmotically-inducible protein OsmY